MSCIYECCAVGNGISMNVPILFFRSYYNARKHIMSTVASIHKMIANKHDILRMIHIVLPVKAQNRCCYLIQSILLFGGLLHDIYEGYVTTYGQLRPGTSDETNIVRYIINKYILACRTKLYSGMLFQKEEADCVLRSRTYLQI